jgi:hypothetical protein
VIVVAVQVTPEHVAEYEPAGHAVGALLELAPPPAAEVVHIEHEATRQSLNAPKSLAPPGN